MLAHDIEMFGNSWMEAEPHQGRCPMVPSGFRSPCARADARVLLVRTKQHTDLNETKEKAQQPSEEQMLPEPLKLRTILCSLQAEVAQDQIFCHFVTV